MEPAYHNHQLLIIDKRAEEFTYGMVVAFWQESLEALLVKRIVALPGDRVQIVGQELYVNDIAVCGGITYAGIAGEKIFLGPGEYFVLGDNLEVSRDSRYEDVGIVKEESIVGRILQ